MEEIIAENSLLTSDARYLSDDSNIIPRDDMLLFPHRLFAFVLKDRKWGESVLCPPCDKGLLTMLVHPSCHRCQ